MKKIFLSLLSVSLFTAPLAAFATGFYNAEDLHLSDTYEEDIYSAGGRVRIDGDASADNVAFGGEIIVNGSTAEDLTVAGGNIRILGAVGDDLRAAGGQVTVTGGIDGDTLIAGGDVVFENDSSINGNLYVAGGELRVFPQVNGNAKLYTGKARLFNAVQGDLTYYGSEIIIDGEIQGNAKIVAQKITFGENASINGNLEYWTKEGETDFSGVVQGSSVYNAKLGMGKQEAKMHKEGMAAGLLALVAAVSVWKILSALLIICVFILASKKFFTDTAKIIFKHPWMNLLKGFGVVVGLPAIGVALLVTVIGIPLGITVFMLWIIILYFAKVLTAITLTYWYARRNKRSWKTWQYCMMSLVTYMILSILFIIPILGWIAVKVVMLIALGALSTTKYAAFQKVR